jgi:hypothetical protein
MTKHTISILPHDKPIRLVMAGITSCVAPLWQHVRRDGRECYSAGRLNWVRDVLAATCAEFTRSLDGLVLYVKALQTRQYPTEVHVIYDGCACDTSLKIDAGNPSRWLDLGSRRHFLEFLSALEFLDLAWCPDEYTGKFILCIVHLGGNFVGENSPLITFRIVLCDGSRIYVCWEDSAMVDRCFPTT